MIRILFLSAFMCLSAFAALALPKASFPVTTHNFGAILEDNGPAKCRFAVVNSGDSPLTILSVRATCGCTTPEYPRKSIAPGDTGYITVAYNPAGRPGRFSKEIYVETDGNRGKMKLVISGVVIANDATVSQRYPVKFGNLRLAKSVFALGDATMGKYKTVYLDAYNRSTDSIKISVVKKPPYLDIAVVPEVVPPGEQATFIAYIAPKKNSPYGVIEDTLTIIAENRIEYKLPTLINVVGDYSGMSAEQMSKAPVASPESNRVDLGKINKSAKVSARLKITNDGASPLHILRIYSVDKGIEGSCTVNTLKKGKSAYIDVTVDPKYFSGDMINSRLQIITNDPLSPVTVVRVIGEWE